MAYLKRTTDNNPASGDQAVNERLQIVSTNDTELVHQVAVNAFLLALKALPDHTVYVRSIVTDNVKTTGPNMEQYTTIWYTLVGDPVLPIIP